MGDGRGAQRSSLVEGVGVGVMGNVHLGGHGECSLVEGGGDLA